MAIFRCNKCGHIREVENNYTGKSVKCPKCDQVTKIHDTIAFLNTLIQKHLSQNKELLRLRQELNPENTKFETAEAVLFEEIDIYITPVPYRNHLN